MYKQDEGDTVCLGQGLMSTIVASKLEVDQATVSLESIHLDENVGDGNVVPTETREVSWINRVEVVADPVTIPVENRRQSTM